MIGRLPIAVGFGLAFISSIASAQNYGVGARSCAVFARDYSQNTQLEDAYFGWAQGFMSGISFEALVADLPLKQIQGGNTAMSAYKQAIRTYCDQHPLAPYSDAVATLYATLPNAPRNSN